MWWMELTPASCPLMSTCEHRTINKQKCNKITTVAMLPLMIVRLHFINKIYYMEEGSIVLGAGQKKAEWV